MADWRMSFNMLRRVGFREFWHERKDWVHFVLVLSMATAMTGLGVLDVFTGPDWDS